MSANSQTYKCRHLHQRRIIENRAQGRPAAVQHPDPDLDQCLVDTNAPPRSFTLWHTAEVQFAEATIHCICEDGWPVMRTDWSIRYAAWSEEGECFVKNRMPIPIQRLAQRVPKKHKRVAEIIFGLMVPGIRKFRRHKFEKMPQLKALPNRMSSEGDQRPTGVETAFFSKFSDSCIEWVFSGLNGALHELLARKRMGETQHLRSPVEQTNDDRTGFLSFVHPAK